MRVVVARASRLGGDGVTRVIECWARILGAAGHQTTVVSERVPGTPALPELPGVRHEFFDGVKTGSRPARLFGSARAAALKIGEFVARGEVDVVLSHESILAVAVRQNLPDIPMLGTFHSPIVDENRLNNWKYAPSLVRRLTYPGSWLIQYRTEGRAIESVNRAHTLSEFTWGLLSARYPRACRKTPWHKIPGSFDHERFVPAVDRAGLRTALDLGADETILLTVRRLVPRNGVDRIVHAARELRDRLDGVRFLIGGTGPLEDELRRRIAAAGVSDSVQLLGFISEERLPGYYQAADAFVLPTRDLECFGLPVIEAMACSCVPLVMPEGGPAEICRDRPEWVARANTDKAFTELVRRFLDGEIERRPNGLARVAAETYSDAAIRPRVLELVETVASERAGASSVVGSAG